MPAPAIAVLNTKGGSGKTTLCVNVATALHREVRQLRPGSRGVAVLDTDAPQHTAADWRARSESEAQGLPNVATVATAGELREKLPALREKYAAVFLDGAGTLEGLTGAAVHAAHVVLIPARPSPADLWGTRDLVDVVKARQRRSQERTGKASGEALPKAAFVVSQAVTGANVSAQVAEALDTFALPMLEGRTGHRVAYAESMATGGTVLDAPSSKAAAEIWQITAELDDLLNQTYTPNE